MVDVSKPFDPPPLSEAARAFLRKVRLSDGPLRLSTPDDWRLAKECKACRYLQIGDDDRARMTGHGHVFLDRMMRAH